MKVKRQEIESVLGEEYVLNPHVGKEFTYDKRDGRVMVRVLSSIPWRENFNEKFIRVCLLHGNTERILTWFKVALNDKWVVNLKFRLLQAHEEAKLVRFCVCGGFLHLKHGRNGSFIACTNCSFKRNVG